ncbi:hypothetical protein SAY86_017554 [Trapa natans]|uniref:Enhancer of polycomb-like protein n=1 Tax=Trapa natans TaxID=22666 RepID=A0AAN7R6M1_TRANT|nr:hypothetical protein SAY86_017554 [Trapa natans]
MPSVGMRRTSRFFGVVKGADGVRVLRSGRRLSLEPSDVKLKKGGEKDEWFSFVDNKGSSNKQIEWPRSVKPRKEIEKADSDGGTGGDLNVSANKAVALLEGGEDVKDKMFGIVFSRKAAKRKAPDTGDSYEKKYGIFFSRRTKKKVEDINSDARGTTTVIESASCSVGSGFSGLLCSLFWYMKKVSLKVSDISGFLLEDPIREVYASHGVHFLRDPSPFGSGIFKFYGCRDYTPMFWVNFSAIPLCFTSIHMDIFLSHCSIPSAHTDNLNEEQVDCDEEVQNFGLASNIKHRRNSKLEGQSTLLRLGLNSHSIHKRMRSLRSRRARIPSFTGLNKNYGVLAFDIFNAKKNGFPFSSVVSGREVRRSGRRKPAQGVNAIRTRINSGTKLVISQDIYSTPCSVNLLIIEMEKCFREEGGTVLLEPSASGEWHLVIKRYSQTRYILKANEVMKPPILNWFNHATVWTGDNGWRLEFMNKDDWVKFKDLYKECFDRNKQVSSPTSAGAAATIPVPGVREVSGYADVNLSVFSRPNSYITMSGDEVSRVMMKRTANYDMDCEDEEWLWRFNSRQQSSENEPVEELEEDNFELMIDAFEKAFYSNPHDFSNDKPSSNLFVDMGRREVVEAVYSYWMKKRRAKRSSLIRALQLNKPRKAQFALKPALRKKRTFKRQARRTHGRGKQLGLIKASVAHRDSIQSHEFLQKKLGEAGPLDIAVSKRQRAQFLMEIADLAAYKAMMILRIAMTAQAVGSPESAAAHFLDSGQVADPGHESFG